MKKMGIKGRLVVSFMGVSLIPLTAISIYSQWKTEDALINASIEQVDSNRRIIKARLDTYFQNLSTQLVTMSHGEEVKSALTNFTSGFESFAEESKYSNIDALAAKRNLSDYYANQFGKEYTKQNGDKDSNSEQKLSTLSSQQLLLQNSYISNNESPLGSKHLLDVAKESNRYNKTHALHHPNFREILEKNGYYDIFIIDAQTGNVVYTVFKELDFATSLKNGPYSNSGLAKAFNSALALPEGDKFVMTDYETYYPSYDAPAGFLASPIYIDGELKGVLAFQISFDEINKVTLQKNSDYKSFETFLVGPEFRMRSDSQADPENRNVRASFRNPEKGMIKNDDIEAGLAGKSVKKLSEDYLGRKIVTSLSPIEVLGHKWVIQSIVLQDEALAALEQMKFSLLISSFVIAIGVVFVGLWYSRSLAAKLSSLADGLKIGAQSVFTTSNVIADVSSKLSEASTEQAASLQQTVASIDEISAMVQRNADSAATSAKASDASNLAAKRGKEKVEQMLGSIGEISRGNEEIMSSIQKSNNEINEIIHVIRAIADKTKVINDIVFQTKLLSFNASVEAARAGEHGKGFAVVAEEVGNLASMSGKAATEITDMLDKSVHQVTKIVEGTKSMMDSLVKTSKDKVESGTRTAKECAGALDEIIKNVASVNDMVREISTASQEQSTGVKEVTKAMSELDQVTQQNNSSSNDASHTARELQLQADKMNEFVKELVVLVTGQEFVNEGASVPPSSGSGNSGIVEMNKFRKSKQSSQFKKVAGLEFEVPKANDSRFEDA